MVVALLSLTLADVFNDHRAIFAGIFHDFLHWNGQRVADDVDADLGIFLFELHILEGFHSVHKSHTAAGDDTFFDSRAGCGESVFDAMFLFFELGFGGCANTDDGNTAGEFRQTFLEFLAVIIAGGVVDLNADLFDTTLDGVGVAFAAHDRCVVFVDRDLFGTAKIFNGGVFQLASGLFGDNGSVGQDGDILQHSLAAIAKTGGFYRDDVQNAADFVQDECRDGFAVNVFSDDDDVALADLDHFFEQGHDVVCGRDFLVVDQDVGITDFSQHVFGVRYEIGADVAAIELHTFHIFGFEFKRLGFFNSDDAVFADFVHNIGDQGADLLILGGNGGNIADFGFGGDADCLFENGIRNRPGSSFDAALEQHGVGAGSKVLETFADDRVGENRGGGGAIASDIVGFCGSFLEQLGAHVFVGIFEFNFFRNRHAVVGDGGRTVFAVEGDIASLGTEGGCDRVRDRVDAILQISACFISKN